MKLELKHLAPYLLYGLKLINVHQRTLSGIRTGCNIVTLNGIREDTISFNEFVGFYELNDFYVFKPILRPLSDFTKEIEHNGEKFVPIVELAKMCWHENLLPDDFLIQTLKEKTVFIAFSDKKNVFGYDSSSNSFFGALDGSSVSVKYQLQLFQKLFEWHFDVFELIPSGIAIDINTLEK